MGMNVWEFEQTVLKFEEIRIVIRAPWQTQVGDYDYIRQAYGTTSVTEWLATRISERLNGHEVVVIDGYGATPNGRTRMATLRETYER
jgi:hypothetical protein